jgi:hypothetical protein
MHERKLLKLQRTMHVKKLQTMMHGRRRFLTHGMRLHLYHWTPGGMYLDPPTTTMGKDLLHSGGMRVLLQSGHSGGSKDPSMATTPVKSHRQRFWPSAPCGFPIVRAYPMERCKRTWSDRLRPHDQKMPLASRPSGPTHIDRDVREDANAVQIGASDTSRLTMRGRVA